MDRTIEKKMAEKAVTLGRTGNPAVLPELIELLAFPSSNVRKLTVSAIGKLAGLVDAAIAVKAIAPILHDPHPQTRQYTIKALATYGDNSVDSLHNLQDIVDNPAEKEYNQRDAALAIKNIQEALRIAEEQAVHQCSRCAVTVTADEYARSMRTFQRLYCDKCFDEVYLRRRNFETNVELNKTIRVNDGTFVQSDGERIIADFLNTSNITYRYDERIRIIEGMAIRPDFYLPEFDVYIEYWGMDTADYKIGMLKKQKLYQQEGKKLISLYFSDKPNLVKILRNKLHKYITF
jgi:hypothetical protein